MSYQILRDCLRTYQAFVKTARSTYFSNLINSNVGRPKVLFSTINKVLNPIATTFPEVSPAVCNDFLEFFITNIQNIRTTITNSGNIYFVGQCDLAILTRFELVSLSDLIDIIYHMKHPVH